VARRVRRRAPESAQTLMLVQFAIAIQAANIAAPAISASTIQSVIRP